MTSQSEFSIKKSERIKREYQSALENLKEVGPLKVFALSVLLIQEWSLSSRTFIDLSQITPNHYFKCFNTEHNGNLWPNTLKYVSFILILLKYGRQKQRARWFFIFSVLISNDICKRVQSFPVTITMKCICN